VVGWTRTAVWSGQCNGACEIVIIDAQSASSLSRVATRRSMHGTTVSDDISMGACHTELEF